MALGADRKTIEDAIANADADGTQSILDIQDIASEPEMCSASPWNEMELEDYFQSVTPTRNDIERNLDMFWDDIERGTARFTVVYNDSGKPVEYFFAGYSFD